MHKLNVLVYGSNSFVSTLNELKSYFKFNINAAESGSFNDISHNEFDVLLCENVENNLKNIENKFSKINCLKVLATNNVSKESKLFDEIINLPTSIKEINKIIESIVAKKKFSKNSSIKIKDYLLDKNEKKLIKSDKNVILTEKEIQLLELFLKNKKAISKNEILSIVWNYSKDADTHTVETHIYRLRRKISDKFSDENFITNNKEGYSL